MDQRVKDAIEKGKAIKLKKEQSDYQKKIDRIPIETIRAKKWINKFLFKIITKEVTENSNQIMLTADHYRMPVFFKFSLNVLFEELKEIEGLNVKYWEKGKGKDTCWQDHITITW